MVIQHNEKQHPSPLLIETKPRSQWNECWVYPERMHEVKNEIMTTLPQTNIAPENRPSQNESSLPTPIFEGLW